MYIPGVRNALRSKKPIHTEEVTKEISSRLCRRRYQSLTEKLTVRKKKSNDYEDFLRKRNVEEYKEQQHHCHYETTEKLEKVLNLLKTPSTIKKRSDIKAEYFRHVDESNIDFKKYIEMESKRYRETRLYLDIELAIIETVAVIERIGSKSRDWRYSVVSYTPAERMNIIFKSALELDALNNSKKRHSERVVTQNRVSSRKKHPQKKHPAQTNNTPTYKKDWSIRHVDNINSDQKYPETLENTRPSKQCHQTLPSVLVTCRANDCASRLDELCNDKRKGESIPHVTKPKQQIATVLDTKELDGLSSKRKCHQEPRHHVPSSDHKPKPIKEPKLKKKSSFKEILRNMLKII